MYAFLSQLPLSEKRRVVISEEAGQMADARDFTSSRLAIAAFWVSTCRRRKLSEVAVPRRAVLRSAKLEGFILSIFLSAVVSNKARNVVCPSISSDSVFRPQLQDLIQG